MEYSHTITRYEANYSPVKFCSLAIDPKEMRDYMRYLHVVDGTLYGVSGHRMHAYSPVDLESGIYRMAKSGSKYILSKVNSTISELGGDSNLMDRIQKLMPVLDEEIDIEQWHSVLSSEKDMHISVLMWRLAAENPTGPGIQYHLLKDALSECDLIRKFNGNWWLVSSCKRYRATIGGLKVGP